jgi:hypothetical protein
LFHGVNIAKKRGGVKKAKSGYFDAVTNPQLVLGGLFCQLTLEKGGLAGLKQLMNYDSDDFYTAIGRSKRIGTADGHR